MTEKTKNKDFPPSPFAKFSGTLQLGNSSVDCYVLDTGARVISLRGTLKAIANREGGNVAEYIGVKGLKPYINSKLVAAGTIVFFISGIPQKAKGITAEVFLDICDA